MNNFTKRAIEVLENAMNFASKFKSSDVKLEHLMLELVSNDDTTKSVLNKINVDTNNLQNEIYTQLNNMPKVSSNAQLQYSREFTEMINSANELAKDGGHEYISVIHLLLATIRIKNFRC